MGEGGLVFRRAFDGHRCPTETISSLVEANLGLGYGLARVGLDAFVGLLCWARESERKKRNRRRLQAQTVGRRFGFGGRSGGWVCCLIGPKRRPEAKTVETG